MTTSLFQLVFAQRDDSRDPALLRGGERISQGRARSCAGGSANSRVSATPVFSDQDRELLRQVQTGNIAAFESLFAQYWEPLWRFSRALTHSDDVAEDIVQSVFTRVWVLRASWNPQGSIQSYLLRAVRNAYLDRQKHHRVMRDYVAAEVPHQPAAATVELHVERSDQQARLNAALAQLPDVRRQAVLLRYEHGLSYAEIGAILGMTSGAAEKQIARTIETLRQRVTE